MLPVLAELLDHAARGLRDAGASFCVVGGLAVSARAVLRTTEDADLAISVASDAQAEQVARGLIAAGYGLRQELEQTAVGRLATLRLISPLTPAGLSRDETPLIDLLFATCGIEPEVVAAATPIELLSGVVLPTARIPHLIAMKLVSESEHRLQDRIDLQHLCAAATEEDISEVAPLLDLISTRGFAGEKNLSELMQEYLTQAGR